MTTMGRRCVCVREYVLSACSVSTSLQSVRHYLITAEDVGTKKTLPDFFGDSAQFKYLCQVVAGQVRVQCDVHGVHTQCTRVLLRFCVASVRA
jgi:hypothetical protein